MGLGTSPGKSALIVVVVVVSLVVVLAAYGWHAALNMLIPLASAVLWVGVMALAAWGAGERPSRWALSTDTHTAEGVFFALITGFGGLIVIAAVLAVLHVLKPIVVLGVIASLASLGVLRLYRSLPPPAGIARPEFHPYWILIVAAGGLSLAAATTLAPFYDQWHYHLAFPHQWLRAGTAATFDRHAYSFFPANMGLLYVYALAGAGGWAAQVVHWFMGALSATGAAVMAGRLGAPRSGRLLAAAIFLCTPSVVQMGALAGADLGVAAFGIAATLAIITGSADGTRRPRRTLVAGVFAGLAVGCKYLALATVVVPLAVVAGALAIGTTTTARLRNAVVAVVIFGLGVGVGAGGWFLRNTIQTSNPTHPYFETVFNRSSDADSGERDRVADGIGDFGLSSDKLVAAATLGALNHRGHSADPGPAYLWLSPLLLIWIWRHRHRAEVLAVAATAAGGVLLWAIGPPLGRYLLPTLALVAACLGASWTELLQDTSRTVRVVLTGLLLALLAANCNPTRGEYLPDQIACFLGAADYDEYLETNCTQLEAVRAANQALPFDAVVLMVGEPRVFGLDRDCVVEDSFRAPLLVEIAENTSSAEAMATDLRDRGVTHLLWNASEAERIAVAENRDHYFECATPQADARLRRFLDGFTSPVAKGAWWEISALQVP